MSFVKPLIGDVQGSLLAEKLVNPGLVRYQYLTIPPPTNASHSPLDLCRYQ